MSIPAAETSPQTEPNTGLHFGVFVSGLAGTVFTLAGGGLVIAKYATPSWFKDKFDTSGVVDEFLPEGFLAVGLVTLIAFFVLSRRARS